MNADRLAAIREAALANEYGAGSAMVLELIGLVEAATTGSLYRKMVEKNKRLEAMWREEHDQRIRLEEQVKRLTADLKDCQHCLTLSQGLGRSAEAENDELRAALRRHAIQLQGTGSHDQPAYQSHCLECGAFSLPSDHRNGPETESIQHRDGCLLA